MRSIQVGDRVLRNHPLRIISPPPSGGFADAEFAGILGGDVLKRFEFTLDLKNAAVYLKPNAAFRANPYEYVTIGIQFFKTGDAFSVVAVWKDSPAEAAGVVVGDRIVSVNGHASASLVIEEFASLLHGPEGTPIAIEVARPSGTLTIRMKVRQLACESEIGNQ